MKKLCFGSLAALLVAVAPASAADLPVIGPVYQAPPPAVVAGYGWTGVYLGPNAGGTWARGTYDWTPDPNFLASGITQAELVALVDAATNTITPTDFIFGGQIGYNYQIGPFVAGAEADINFTSISGSQTTLVVLPGATSQTTIMKSLQSHWLATARGRLGTSWNRVLVYATAGLAAGSVGYSDYVQYIPGGTINTASTRETRVGWTAGGGVEWILASSWSVKVEYLYVDLGHTSYVSANSNPILFPTVNWTHDHRLMENIARIGLNYRFGGSPSYVNY